MPDIDRRLIIILSAAVALALVVGFVMGRATSASEEVVAGDVDTTSTTSAQLEQPVNSTSTTTTAPQRIDGDPASVLPPPVDIPSSGIPVFGSEADRDQMLSDLAGAGVVGGSSDSLLATADHICFNLERLSDQNRSSAFAVRVIWNESLGDLPSEDVAAFGVVFNSAPHYLCPDQVEYAESIAYWLGI